MYGQLEFTFKTLSNGGSYAVVREYKRFFGLMNEFDCPLVELTDR